MTKVLVIQGPNLNLLGRREPDNYGHKTLDDIHADLKKQAAEASVDIAFYQSNVEGELINRVQSAKSDFDFIIINPAAYTHTSVALRDAFLAVELPFIEVHLSNVHQREDFRQHSYLSDIAVGVITGLGDQGYGFALSYAIQYLTVI